jgi:hypothetical protein
MAAETDDPKPGDDADRRNGRDRRRPPLTIDLTAEQVAGRSPSSAEAAAPPPEGKGPGAAETRASAAKLWPTFAAIIPRDIDRETWIGWGSAAALGGVVALVLLMILQSVGILPAPGAAAVRTAAEQARAASDSIASLDRRLTAVEAMTEGIPALRADVAATGGQVATLGKTAAGLAPKSDVDALKTDLAGIKSRLDQAAAAPSAADLAALSQRVGRVEAALAGGGPAVPSAATAPSDLADVQARIAALAQRLDAAEAAIGHLSSASASANTAGVRSAALAGLRDAVDAGMPFMAELDVLAALGSDQVTTGLKPYAATGIATRDALRMDFAQVSDAILAATQGTGDDSLLGRLAAGARGLVSIRPAGPIAGSDPSAIVSRMVADVAMGDFASALGERDGLPAAGKDASATWATQAAARVKADALLGNPLVTGATGNG